MFPAATSLADNPKPPGPPVMRPDWRIAATMFVARLAAAAIRTCRRIGDEAIERFRTIISILALLAATAVLAVRPRTWTRPVQEIFARQMLFTSVDAVMVSFRFGAAVGVLFVVQAALWVDSIGVGTEVITPTLWKAIVRELAPLLACMVVIGRSGIAISTELATMQAGGEIEVMDSSGMDPMTCLVMPRVLAVIISVFCLAIIIAATMIGTGYVVGYAMNAVRVSWTAYASQVFGQFQTLDLLFFLPKTILAAGFAGAICCMDGLSVRETITDVPRVSARSGIRALTAVFLVSAVLSVLIYGRILIFEVL